MKKIHIQALAALFLIPLFPSCKGHSKTAPETKQEEVLPEDIVELRQDQIDLAEIQTGSVELRAISGTLKVSGTISAAPQSQASVCVPMGGFVKKSSLLPGNAVRKGQILAVVENQDFIDIQQNYLEAKNKLAYAEAEYKRQSELYKSDVSSQKNLQQVTSEYKTLQAQTKALQQKLLFIGINPAHLHEDGIRSFVNVVSPISGYVKTVNINLGKFVAPSDVLFEIVNSDKLFLELTLFEKDADKVSNGQKIHFFINNETEQHEAVIYQTGKSIGEDKTYKVYASVSGKCKNVLPGMYVNAIIEASTSKVTALPSDAIVSFDDKSYIFIVNKIKKENGKPFTEYRMIEVQKGVSDGGYMEVILPADFDQKTSKIVVKGAYNLLSAKKNAGEMSC
jgi:membrane fusion protein, heavy metal efflux system